MGWNKLEDILLTRYQGAITILYDEPVNLGMKKLIVAYEQHTEDILRDLWSKSQSELSYGDWKKRVVRKNNAKQIRKRGRRGNATISGPDLAQM